MDSCEAAQMVFARVKSMEPENVNRIMGQLLLDQNADMFTLAFSTDSELKSTVSRAKKDLILKSTKPGSSNQSSSTGNGNTLAKKPSAYGDGKPNSPTSVIRAPISPISRDENGARKPISPTSHDENGARKPISPTSDGENGARKSISPTSANSFSSRCMQAHFDSIRQQVPTISPVPARSSPSVLKRSFSAPSHSPEPQSPVAPSTPEEAESKESRPCLYFAKGFCKNGNGCRFLHNVELEQGELSLEKLEAELEELLRTRKGVPIQISALPHLYFERFGRWLEADGYVSNGDSQRLGKSGIGLSKLLSKLKDGSITMVDRPHGQHAIMLTEDFNKYCLPKAESDDCDPSPCSRQIYLTFPADSNFTEEDVATHFRAYGPVQDVRIPCQYKRMFGFVTFKSAETVRTILAEGNPHHVCGARVLVKPYREKSKPTRKHLEKLANDEPKEFSLIGSDADRRLEDEKRELELRIAELKLAKSRAQEAEAAAAAALLAANAKFQNGDQFFKPDIHTLPPVPGFEQLQLSPPFGLMDNFTPEVPLTPPRLSDGGFPLNKSYFGPIVHPRSRSLSPASPSPVRDLEKTCCICFGTYLDPVQLECRHTFCVPCLLKVLQNSQDECPVCSWNLGKMIQAGEKPRLFA